MDTTHHVHPEDLAPVGSRLSWGAILAGAVVAFVVHFVLGLVGVALGLTLASDGRTENLGTAAAVYAVVVALAALFVGGCVTSRCTAGETRMEAAMYGTILWGVVFALLVWLAAIGVRVGFNAVLGAASTPAAQQAVQRLSADDLRNMGLTQEQINQVQARLQNAAAGQGAEQPLGQSAEAVWWTVGGIVLSLLAAVGGALVSAGPGHRHRDVVVRPAAEPMRAIH